MILDNEQVRRLYARTAKFYDFAVSLSRPLGVRRHRRLAVDLLNLQRGQTVVDLGTGTGLNLPLLRGAVGAEGRVVGIDISEAMLTRARRRVEEAGWSNVELVQADLREYAFDARLDGALATFALEMLPDHDRVLRRLADRMARGGRLALLGLKHPERWPEWLIEIGVWLNRPFGVSRDYAGIQPWITARRSFREVRFRELYAGAGYLWAGEVE